MYRLLNSGDSGAPCGVPRPSSWLTARGADPGAGPWGWLGKDEATAWRVVGRPFEVAFAKAAGFSRLNPLALRSMGAYAAAKAAFPDGTTIDKNFWAVWGEFWDGVNGFLDSLTGGLWGYAREGLNKLFDLAGLGQVGEFLGLKTDYSSDAYALGAKIGAVANLLLPFLGGAGGALGTVVKVLQISAFLGAGISTGKALVEGDLVGALRGASAMVLLGLGLTGTQLCELPTSVQVAFRGLLVGGAAAAGYSAGKALGEGDLFGAALDLLEMGTDLFGAARACFTGDMLLDAEAGKRRADAVRVGDRLWARDERDPRGAPALKEVQEVFVRVAPVWNVHAAGQVIRTTREHPFYVEGRGWLPAGHLEIGDLLYTRDGRKVPVEGVADSGDVTTVYNWRVADYHTYFVSSEEWGASLWAHNASYAKADPATKEEGTRLYEKAVNWADTLPMKHRFKVTVAVTTVDGVDVVSLHANPGYAGKQVPQRVIDAFGKRVNDAGGVFLHSTGKEHHAETLLHQTYPGAPAIGISNPKGPCDGLCGPYFDRTRYYNVYWPDP